MEVDNKGTFTFIWRIENISYCLQTKGETLKSPVFIIDALDKSRWSVALYPNGRKKHLEYYLVNFTSEGSAITVDYRLFLMGSDGNAQNIQEWTCATFHCNDGYGVQNVHTLEDIYGTKRSIFLPHDILTIVCQLRIPKVDNDENVECFSRTLIGLKRFSKLWKIHDIRDLKLKGEESVTVSLAEVDVSPVILKVSTKGESFSEEWLNIEISISACYEKLLLSCKISVMDNIGESVKEMIDRCFFLPGEELTWTFPKFIFLSELSDLLPGDNLSLKLECILSDGVEYQKIVITHYGLSETSNMDSLKKLWIISGNFSCNEPQKSMDSELGERLKDDMLSLYQEKTLSDFELKVGDATLPVHKAILCARSPFFKAMLNKNIWESERQSFIVPDVDADTLSKFLLYVYTDTVENLELESAFKLYNVSQKYLVPTLKQKCSSAVKSHLTVQNVSIILAFADKHQDNELISVVHDFILQYDGEVMQSAEWLEFDKNTPQLAAKTMYQVYRKKLQTGYGKKKGF